MKHSRILLIGVILTVIGLTLSYRDNSDPLALVFGIPGILLLSTPFPKHKEV